MEPPKKIESPKERQEREALIGQLTLEELQEGKRIRDERRAREAKEAEMAKLGDVMVYSVYDNYHIQKQSQRRKKEVAHDNTVRYVDDPDFNHQHYQFNRHRCWIPRSDMQRIRNVHGYRVEFIEAIALNDGDPLAMSLEELLETPAGDGWLANMASYSKRAGIKPPLGTFEIRQQIKGLRNGTVKPPKKNGIVSI